VSFPVVIAANGLGIPVIPVVERAPGAVVATNGYGIPIVIVETNGTPMIIEGLTSPAFASGVLSWDGNATDGETVTIGAVVYTFVTLVVDPYDVLIGVIASQTNLNLAAAIVAGAGAGIVYGSGTLEHPDVFAEGEPGVLNATAKVIGAAGNSIATTSTTTNATWGAATLEGGAG
jgi:hypothetical protein